MSLTKFLSPKNDYAYEQEVKRERELDAIAIREQQLAEGAAKGKAEGKAEVANKLINLGVAIEIIIAATGLTRKEIEEIKANISDQRQL